MEKVAGVPLRTRRHALALEDKCKVLDQLVQVEVALFSTELPASGSIYHKGYLDPETVTVPVPGMPENSDFCIGPDASTSWWLDERAALNLDRGPYCTPQDTMASVAKRETAWMTQGAQPRFPSQALHRELFDYQRIPPTPHIENLSQYLRISDQLVPKQPELNRFILRHPDLSPNNVFVNKSLEVLGVIDWQHSCVLSIFLHVGIPEEIQNFDDKESLAMNLPELPDNFTELSLAEQEAASETMRRRELHITYVYFTREMNPDHAAALAAPYGILRKRLFHRAGTAWQGDNISLETDLIRISRLWKQVTSSMDENGSKCPLDFSTAETEQCLELSRKCREAEDQVEHVRNELGMTRTGCVLPEHYDEIKERCRLFKAQALAMAETDREKEEVLRHFPFDDHDESGRT
ncbi:MAG: hypothetical protein Q9216_005562 [Gyalolechia sp. 2 TL-2023]